MPVSGLLLSLFDAVMISSCHGKDVHVRCRVIEPPSFV